MCLIAWLQDYSGAIQAIFAGIVAVFTGLLAYLTVRLWRATKDAADAAKKSADVAADAFTKLERPYVYIFGVSKFEISRDRAIGQQPHVKYVVANYGKTPATIESIRAGIGSHPDEPLDPLPIDYLDDPAHGLLRAPILAPGEKREGLDVTAPDGIDFAMPSEEVVPTLAGQDQLFVWIIVKYSGPFTNGHETSACWRYYDLTNRLITHGGEQYNYTK